MEDKKMGRPKKKGSEKRVKHTTSLNEGLLKWAKHYAIEQQRSTADIIEEALAIYRNTIAQPLNIKSY